MSASATATRSRPPFKVWARSIGWLLGESIVAVLIALVIGGIGMALLSGLLPRHGAFEIGLPIAAYGALWSGAVGSQRGIIDTLEYATPLILAGLGIGLGFKAGLFNIGGRGQFLMGTIGALAVVTILGGSQPWFVTLTLALIAATVLGAFAGFIPGALKATSGAHEVVTTIMLNYVFVFATYWAISGPLRLPNSPQPITADVNNLNGALPVILTLERHSLHLGIVFAMLAVPLVWFLLYRTTLGFEIRAAGANSDAARYAGMKTRRLIVTTMSMSGALCGFAGATTLLGVVHQIAPGYDTTIGFDAITVALLGRSNPFGIAVAGLLLGGMRAGAQAMQVSPGVPAELVDALQAVILLFLVINMLRRWRAARQDDGATAAKVDSGTPSFVSAEVGR